MQPHRISLIGHPWAVTRLQAAIDSGSLAQSHAFVGPPSIGKSTLAREVAACVLGRGAADPARAGALVLAGRHPDLSWVELAEGKSRISIDQIRELMHMLSLSPVEGAHRVGVVADAHLVSEEGQNALLKTLEEPNSSVILILTAPTVESLLPTIVSRCQITALRSTPERVIAAALRERGVEHAHSAALAHFARGRVGWAIRASAEPELLEERQRWVADLERLLGANRTARFAYAEALAREDPEHVQRVLEEWTVHWRAHELHRRDARIELPMMRVLVETHRRIRLFVNPRLALDALMLQMPTADR